MFLPDQKVICINDRFPLGIEQFYTQLPTKGEIYTIRDIVPGIEWNGTATITVYLTEITNPPNPHGIEYGFHLTRFRELTPLEEKLLATHTETTPQKSVNP